MSIFLLFAQFLGACFMLKSRLACKLLPVICLSCISAGTPGDNFEDISADLKSSIPAKILTPETWKENLAESGKTEIDVPFDVTVCKPKVVGSRVIRECHKETRFRKRIVARTVTLWDPMVLEDQLLPLLTPNSEEGGDGTSLYGFDDIVQKIVANANDLPIIQHPMDFIKINNNAAPSLDTVLAQFSSELDEDKSEASVTDHWRPNNLKMLFEHYEPGDSSSAYPDHQSDARRTGPYQLTNTKSSLAEYIRRSIADSDIDVAGSSSPDGRATSLEDVPSLEEILETRGIVDDKIKLNLQRWPRNKHISNLRKQPVNNEDLRLNLKAWPRNKNFRNLRRKPAAKVNFRSNLKSWPVLPLTIFNKRSIR